MGTMSGKVNGLYEAMEEFHTRLEKVDMTSNQNETAEPEYNIFDSGIE